jgi:hypothetical protein
VTHFSFNEKLKSAVTSYLIHFTCGPHDYSSSRVFFYPLLESKRITLSVSIIQARQQNAKRLSFCALCQFHFVEGVWTWQGKTGFIRQITEVTAVRHFSRRNTFFTTVRHLCSLLGAVTWSESCLIKQPMYNYPRSPISDNYPRSPISDSCRRSPISDNYPRSPISDNYPLSPISVVPPLWEYSRTGISSLLPRIQKPWKQNGNSSKL